MITILVLLLVGFQIKHFVADYLGQPQWVIEGKASLTSAGGYVHAGAHALLSLGLLLLIGLDAGVALGLSVAEFALHYLLDYAKLRYSAGVHQDERPGRFWALFGLDQTLHQLTYVAMVAIALMAMGLV